MVEDKERIVRLGRHGRITLPSSICREAGIAEGDLLSVRWDGEEIVLTPKLLIDKSQSYFWTEAWQQDEQQAEADIQEDRVQAFETVDDLVNWLDKPHD